MRNPDLVLATALLAACAGTPAPAPTAAPQPKAAEPTKAPAAPTKAPEPTKAAAQPTAVQPAAAPAKKVDFPTPGKTLSLLVAYDPGSASDLTARLLAPYLEKELGIPVQVVNKPGAGGQVGITELAKARPDGYTIGYTPLPNMVTLVDDPQRKAAFTRKDFQPLAMELAVPNTVAVMASSPYKTMKDLVDAAKANPSKITVGLTGILASPHLNLLSLEKVAGIKLAPVHFNSGVLNMNALLGGHLEARIGEPADYLANRDQIRPLGVVAKEELPQFPGVKTLIAQGYPVASETVRAICMPAGAPKEIVDILAGALGRAIKNEEHLKKLVEANMAPRYGDPAAFAATWDQVEEEVRPLIPLAQAK